MKSFRDLDVWKSGIELVDQIYSATREFPNEERFGLAAQLRKSAVSIPSNISEGAARHHTKEFIQFCYIARGSCAELSTQVLISLRQGYMTDEKHREIAERIDHISRMLSNLIKALQR